MASKMSKEELRERLAALFEEDSEETEEPNDDTGDKAVYVEVSELRTVVSEELDKRIKPAPDTDANLAQTGDEKEPASDAEEPREEPNSGGLHQSRYFSSRRKQ